jgi:hypothetical protein
MGKRVLIITYYWPPLAGSGVQRWLKFAKYLPDFGWEPIIFTPENPDFELNDHSLLYDISPNLEVIKFPIWEPYQLFRRFKKGKPKNVSSILENRDKSLFDRIGIAARANFLVPDPRIFWVKPSTEFLIDCVLKGQFDAIISTGPPHSLHLIARNVKRKTGIPWIADFRDPWTQWDFNISLPMMNWVRRLHKNLEKSVLSEASEIVTISPTFQKEFATLSNKNVRLITNGFDESDQNHQGISPLERKTFDELEILYTGVIDALRDPVPFFNVMKSVFSQSRKSMKCRFVGKVPSSIIDYVRNDEYLKEHVIFEGYVSHQKVFDFYQRADLLLLVLTKENNSKGNIPGKVFEYMASGKFTLALGNPQGDTAHILSSSNAGRVFLHSDHEGLFDFLNQFDPKVFSTKKQEVDQYSRKKLTEKLVKLINDIVENDLP